MIIVLEYRYEKIISNEAAKLVLVVAVSYYGCIVVVRLLTPKHSLEFLCIRGFLTGTWFDSQTTL